MSAAFVPLGQNQCLSKEAIMAHAPTMKTENLKSHAGTGSDSALADPISFDMDAVGYIFVTCALDSYWDEG